MIFAMAEGQTRKRGLSMRKTYFTVGTVIFGVVFGLPAYAQTCTPAYVKQMQNIDKAVVFCTTDECRVEAANLKRETRELCERVVKHNQHPTKIGYTDIMSENARLDKKLIDWGNRHKIFAPEKTVGVK
jgi:hypothetical protein